MIDFKDISLSFHSKMIFEHFNATIQTGEKVGYKPAGGIVTTEDAVKHYTLVKEILGEGWLNNKLFRLGASRLANNLLTSILGKETKYF